MYGSDGVLLARFASALVMIHFASFCTYETEIGLNSRVNSLRLMDIFSCRSRSKAHCNRKRSKYDSMIRGREI